LNVEAYLSVSAFRATLPGCTGPDQAWPWATRRELIAANVEELHGDFRHDRNNIRKPMRRRAQAASQRGFARRTTRHADRIRFTHRAIIGRPPFTTCTTGRNGAGSAVLGHHDRLGGANTSWNAAHGSAGCSQQDLVSTGGAGLFYCFAAD
jgi:hypothetical protein